MRSRLSKYSKNQVYCPEKAGSNQECLVQNQVVIYIKKDKRRSSYLMRRDIFMRRQSNIEETRVI